MKSLKCNFNHFEIDEETHQYKLIAVPSVSKVLDKIDKYYDYWITQKTDYSKINEKILKLAQQRGNCFHKCLETFIKNGRDLFSIPYCVCENQVLAHTHNILVFIEWYAKNSNRFDKIEHIYSEQSYLFTGLASGQVKPYCQYLYCGTIDLSFEETLENGDKILHIIDFKTSSRKETKKWSQQLNLYLMLYWNKQNQEDLHYKEIKLSVLWIHKDEKNNKTIDIIEIEKEYTLLKTFPNLVKAIEEVHRECVNDYLYFEGENNGN